MFLRLFSFFLTSLLLFGSVHAQTQTQTRSSLDSSTCMMWNKSPLYGGLLDRYSHELYIWYWHAYGFSEVRKLPNWVNQQDRFSECFDKKTEGNCGFKSSGSIKKALAKNRTDGFNKKPLKDLFQERPPREAVKFAMKSLGTCFGNDPALPTLEELGLVSGNFDMDGCGLLASYTTYKISKLPPEMASHSSWGYALNKYMTSVGDPTPGKACGVMPKAGVPFYEAFIEREKKKQNAYENRTIAQRIAGLDAYDITYSLVSRTTSGEHSPTRPLPEDAAEWMKFYVSRVENGHPQPEIPDAVQEWAIQQPLDNFDAVEDPFVARKRLRSYEISQYVWSNHVRSRLDKVAPNEARITVTEGCSILWGIAHGDVNFGRRSAGTPGEREYYRLLKQTPDKWAQSMCDETPVNIFYDGKALHAKRMAEEAYAAANPPPPTIWDELAKAGEQRRVQGSIRAPYKPATRRCYDTGQTESGLTNRVCFTN